MKSYLPVASLGIGPGDGSNLRHVSVDQDGLVDGVLDDND